FNSSAGAHFSAQSKRKFVIWLLEFVNNYLNFKDPVSGLMQIGFIILLVAIVKGIFYFLQYYLSSMAGQLTVKDIRQDLYRHLWSLSLDYFYREHTGALLSHFIYDLNFIERAISKGIRDLFINIFQIVIFAAILFGLDWRMTLTVILCAPIMIFPIIKLGHKIRDITKKMQDKMAEINIILQETIMGVRIVRAFNMEDTETYKFRNENELFLKFRKKFTRITSLQVPVVEALFTIIAVGILGYGGMRILDGHLTKGEFFMYFGTLLALTPHISVLSNVYGIVLSAEAGMEKIVSILEIKPAILDKDKSIEHIIQKDISFKNVNFCYEEKTPVLKNINLTIKKDEIVAIVGPSGAGKTSMIDLLLRFYSPAQGKIEIDGIDISDISIASLRNQIGIVTQDTFLFHDTIQNNISYSKESASMEEIIHAAEKANAMQFIKKMPNGFNTIVGERGTQLSGGERQRLSIARVILKNPPILILDEATSSLDSESEKQVQEALNTLFLGHTTVVIAHRLSTIHHADRIVVMDKGMIVDTGSHDELMRRCVLYRELYELQFIK
ncbi:ABC transporter ATP-binding protein, partial [Candidatus Desantisbacteria bacterium]|nr:ABC transporter ATP-binding protein [Candidatus Desantisbacteria bacterium]